MAAATRTGGGCGVGRWRGYLPGTHRLRLRVRVSSSTRAKEVADVAKISHNPVRASVSQRSHGTGLQVVRRATKGASSPPARA